jgi:hypothetical protein
MNKIVFNPLFEKIVINRQRTVKKSIYGWFSGADSNLTIECVPSTPLSEHLIVTILDSRYTKA